MGVILVHRPVQNVDLSASVMLHIKEQCAGNVCIHGVVALFVKGTTIPCKTRLALNADRTTETDILG